MAPERSSDMAVTRRGALLGAAGVAAVVIAGVSAQPVTAGAGSGPVGTNGSASGLEFLGEISQTGHELTGYGYFTLVQGLAADQIFFGDAAPSVATARFTFFSTAHITSHQGRGDVSVTHADGHVDIYLRDTPGASFDDPSSFAAGQVVASDDAAFENITSVIAPNTANMTVFGDLRRTAVSQFRLGRNAYQLGTMGLRSRLIAPGKGVRLDPVTPRAILTVGGNMTNPTPVGGGHGG